MESVEVSKEQEMKESVSSAPTEPTKDSRLDKKAALRNKMLVRLSQTDAHFKHQLRGEPDLSTEEKIKIASEILDRNAVIFLARFSKFLSREDIEYFSDRSDEYEIKFYMDLICKEQNKTFSANRVKNRRYEAMKQLISEGDYFSEENMKFREPFLYHQMIGQYITDEEAAADIDKSDMRFSSILLKNMDLTDAKQRRDMQQDIEEGQMAEEEEDSDDDMDLEGEEEEIDEDGNIIIPESKKAALREEFQTIMQERFLTGRDQDFDYSKVDDNAEYDDLDILDKDEEEKYFDAEDSDEESVPNITSHTQSMHLSNGIDDSGFSQNLKQTESNTPVSEDV